MIRRWSMMGLIVLLMSLAGCGGGCGSDANKGINSTKDRPKADTTQESR